MSSSTSSSSIFTPSLRLFISKAFPKPIIKLNPSSPIQSRPLISFQRIPTTTTRSNLSPPSMDSPVPSIEQLPPKLQEIIKLFQSVSDPKAKYAQLMFYGKNLKPLDPIYKTNENKVQGCVSQVWVRAYLDDLEKRNVFYEADSDAVLTKGIAALLVNGLSGNPAEEVLRLSPDFAVLLGLQQSLSPSRNNGMLNMFKLMQKKALELLIEAEKGPGEKDGGIGEDGAKVSSYDVENLNLVESDIDGDDNSGNDGNGSISGGLGSRGERIREILQRELSPVALEVDDVSYQHAGHAGVRGSDGETHFNLKVVSNEFEGKSLVKRHRMIYNLLQEELDTGLHALSIVAKTPAEVQPR